MYYSGLLAASVPFMYATVKLITSVLVFPGQLFAKPRSLHNFYNEHPNQKITFGQETTELNRILATVKIEPANKTGDVIIVFNGQNATFRTENKLKLYCQIAKDTKATVIGFDYGGTGKWLPSTWSSDELVNDGLHMALKAANEMPEDGNLILKGNSLGGGIETKVEKRCHDPDININAYLWNGRSFRTASAVAAGQIRTLRRSGHFENSITVAISKAAHTVVSFILTLTRFEVDAASDYKKIPAAYKNYYLVRSDEANRADKKDDVIIPHCASLEADEDIKNEAKDAIQNGNINDPTDIAYYRARRKMIYKYDDNAHGAPENELFCRKESTLSAYALFCKFSTVYVRNHGAHIKKSHSPVRHSK